MSDEYWIVTGWTIGENGEGGGGGADDRLFQTRCYSLADARYVADRIRAGEIVHVAANSRSEIVQPRTTA